LGAGAEENRRSLDSVSLEEEEEKQETTTVFKYLIAFKVDPVWRL